MLDKPDAQFRVGEAAWVVVLMSTCFGFSYLDRNVLTILTQPIKHSLALSDTQIGVLGGFAFSIFIFLGGLPLAWLIDRTNRIRLTAACVFVWSAARIMSGLSLLRRQRSFPRVYPSSRTCCRSDAFPSPAQS